MPRSRGSEMPQRPSPRGPAQLRTSASSNSDPLHHRPITDRSSKVGDRRSPRSVQSDPLSQKKLGTRIAGLESQLGQAQEELKILKEQLASLKAAKKDAEDQLERKTPNPPKVQDKQGPPTGAQELNERKDSSNLPKILDDIQRETYVFEVPVDPNVELSQSNQETKPISPSTQSPEPQKPAFDELALKNDEINSLKAKLEEKEREMGVSRQENESLKHQLNEVASERSSSRAKEEEMSLKLRQLGQQLEASRATEVELKERVEAVEGAKEALETEMKKLRVQTEQWRKAADTAAAVLAGGVEMNNGGRMWERYGSMDKHIGNFFEPSVGGGGGGYMGLGASDDLDDGKRKGSGIRMLGDLWKKKAHK